MPCAGFASYQIHGDGTVEVNGAVPTFSASSPNAKDMLRAWGAFGSELSRASEATGVPVTWLLGVMMAESGGGQVTCSPCSSSCCSTHAGRSCCAFGIMQFTPVAAKQYGTTIEEIVASPALAVRKSAELLRDLLRRYDGDFPAALAAYNTGSARCTGAGEFGYATGAGYIPKILKYSNTAIQLGITRQPSASLFNVVGVALLTFVAGSYLIQRVKKGSR